MTWLGAAGAGGLGLEPRLHGSKGRRAADYPIPHQNGRCVKRPNGPRTAYEMGTVRKLNLLLMESYAPVGYVGVAHRRRRIRPTPQEDLQTHDRYRRTRDRSRGNDRPRSRRQADALRAQGIYRAVHALRLCDRALRSRHRRHSVRVGLGSELGRRRPLRLLLLPLRHGGDDRISPLLHPRLVQSEPDAEGRFGDRRQFGGRGSGHPVGRRSSSPSRLQRPRRRSAFAVALRGDHVGPDQGTLVGALGLAVRPREDQPGALRPRPAGRQGAAPGETSCFRCWPASAPWPPRCSAA